MVFWRRALAQTYYSQFTNRKQKYFEDLATLEYRVIVAFGE